jgi:hypothetical protein
MRDLAAVIGASNPGRWVAVCSVEEFAAELIAQTGGGRRHSCHTGQPRAAPQSAVAGLFGGVARLHSRFLQGALRLSSGRGGSLIATYTDSLFGHSVRLTAKVWIGGHSARAQCSRGRPPRFIHARVLGYKPEPRDDPGSGDIRQHARPPALGCDRVALRTSLAQPVRCIPGDRGKAGRAHGFRLLRSCRRQLRWTRCHADIMPHHLTQAARGTTARHPCGRRPPQLFPA